MLMFTIYAAVVCLGIALIQLFFMPALARYTRGDCPAALLWVFNKVYVRVFHRLKAHGCEIVPTSVHPGKLIVAALRHGKLSPVAEYAIDNPDRYLTMICGNNHEDRIPPKQRMQLKRAGFSLHNLP